MRKALTRNRLHPETQKGSHTWPEQILVLTTAEAGRNSGTPQCCVNQRGFQVSRRVSARESSFADDSVPGAGRHPPGKASAIASALLMA